MDGDEIQRFTAHVATELPGAEQDSPFGPDSTVYRVGGKIFALVSTPHGRPLVNFKVAPEHGEVLRQTIAGIEPGYHMNKKHWISLAGSEQLTGGLVTELIHESYELVVESLPRKERPVEYRFRNAP